MGKWFLVLTLLIVAILVAFGIFVATGVIDGPALFWNVGLKTTWLKPHLETYTYGQDAEAWIQAKEDELQLQREDLEKREAALVQRNEELEQKAQQLAKVESDLNKRKTGFEAELAQNRNVQKLAEIYTEMSSEEAARILEKLDQALILDVLLLMDMQDAANILTKLPTNLAVALSKQLGQASQ